MVLTGSRAEYGLLKRILWGIQRSEKLELYIVVTGSHLLKQYGYTINEIKEDGFQIWKEIVISSNFADELRVPIEMGNLMIHLSRVFAEERPDILVLLGDRYEALAAASVAVGLHIPIAHISGGESTEGAMDEQIRHAVTKMSHIHFPGASIYADNIKRMGEEAWRVFEVGDPGIENIKNVVMIDKKDLEVELNINIDKSTLLVTYHPVTLEMNDLEFQMDNLIRALSNYKGTIIITYPNSDAGSRMIIHKWEEFAKGKKMVRLVHSLGIVRYLSVMHYCGAVIGNSSSAIVEAPYLKVPTVNIGNRQKGRLMADSIVCCGYSQQEIEDAIDKVLSKEFVKVVQHSNSLYGEGDTSVKIVDILETINIDDKLLKKKLCWDI